MGTTFKEYVPDKLRDLANQVLKYFSLPTRNSYFILCLLASFLNYTAEEPVR